MGYAGITPSEYSTGKSHRKGAITKSGSASTPSPRRGRLVVSPSTSQWSRAAGAPAKAPGSPQRDWMESSAPAPPALCRVARQRQATHQDHHCSRSRATRLRVGHRGPHRKRPRRTVRKESSRCMKPVVKSNRKPTSTRTKENPRQRSMRQPCADPRL